MEDLVETFHYLAEEEVNLPISKHDLEIALKREGKVPWNITDVSSPKRTFFGKSLLLLSFPFTSNSCIIQRCWFD